MYKIILRIKHKMIINIIFTILTLFSIYTGIKFGWIDSHTPPLPFVISSLLFIAGLLLLLFKRFLFSKARNFIVHLILIAVNFVIVLICLLFPF